MTSRGVLGPQPARGRYSGVMFWLSRKTLSAVALALERHEPPVLSIAVDRARDVAFGIGNVVDVVHNRRVRRRFVGSGRARNGGIVERCVVPDDLGAAQN